MALYARTFMYARGCTAVGVGEIGWLAGVHQGNF
jgi:hypothetical protein